MDNPVGQEQLKKEQSLAQQIYRVLTDSDITWERKQYVTEGMVEICKGIINSIAYRKSLNLEKPNVDGEITSLPEDEREVGAAYDKFKNSMYPYD